MRDNVRHVKCVPQPAIRTNQNPEIKHMLAHQLSHKCLILISKKFHLLFNDRQTDCEVSAEEFNEWMDRTSKYFDESFAWSCKCIQNNTERIKLIEEFLKLLIELWTLEANEKWLLISIALRSQPNLMRFIEGGNAK